MEAGERGAGYYETEDYYNSATQPCHVFIYDGSMAKHLSVSLSSIKGNKISIYIRDGRTAGGRAAAGIAHTQKPPTPKVPIYRGMKEDDEGIFFLRAVVLWSCIMTMAYTPCPQ